MPQHLRDEEVSTFFDMVKRPRDQAIFKVMLRCGLRVEEVATLTLGAIDLTRRRIYVHNGKGGKDRVVLVVQNVEYILPDYQAEKPF